jgi:tetratricopeptide (TPR) repeat protein
MAEDVNDGPTELEVEAMNLLREGERLSRQKDHVGALEQINKAIGLDPSNAMAWYNRGVLLEGQRDAKGAKQSFTICLDLEPENAPATANLAVLLERMGDVGGAEAMATRALTHYPNHPELLDIRRRCASNQAQTPDLPSERPTTSATWEDQHLTRAMRKAGVSDARAVLEESSHHDVDGDGRLDESELRAAATVVAAQQQAQEAIAASTDENTPADPPSTSEVVDLESVINMAQSELDAGHPKQAVALLKPHLKSLAKNDARAWRVAAVGMHRLNLDDHARGAAQHALRLDVTDPQTHGLIGDLHAARGEREQALAAYDAAVDQGAGEEVLVRRWAVLDRTETPDRWYIEAMDRLTPEAPSPDRHALAMWLVALGEGEAAALERLEGQPRTIPEGPSLATKALTLLGDDLPRIRARAHSLRQEHLEAIGLWKHEVTSDGDDASAWTGMAKALESAGELEKAAKCHAKANALSGAALNESIQLNETPTGHSVDAVSVVDPAEQHIVNEAMGAAPDAPQSVDPSEALLFTPVEPAVTAEALPNEAGGTADPSLLLLTPVEPEPTATPVEHEPSLDLVAAALDVTAAQAQQVRTTTPEQERAQGREWFNRGTELLDAKKFREALNCFDKALSLLADDEDKVILVLNARGNCFYYMEDYPKCVEAYHQAMLIRPAQVRGQTLYNMGVAYAEMERYPDAIKCFEQAEPRGLSADELAMAKEQVRRCKILQKEYEKRMRTRR